MTAITIDGFDGLAPIYDPRKLPNGAAVVASNLTFDGGDIRPLHAPVKQALLGFEVAKLYKYTFHGASRWLAWPRGHRIAVVRSPIPQDSYGRIYWSRVNPATADDDTSDNYPRVASQPTQADILGNNDSVHRLGVPQPTTEPSWVEQKADTSITGTDITAMSETSPVTVTAPNHPFEDGWVVLVASEKDSDGGMAEMSGMQFVVHGSTADTFELMASDGAHYTAFTSKTDLTISRVYGIDDSQSRTYVYTYVTRWGEEGMPSLPSKPKDVHYDSSALVTVAKDLPDWAMQAVNRVRLYRSASGAGGTQFFFVKEVALPAATPFTITDDVDPRDLAELLPSETWLAPPNALRGLTAMPNGFLVGFKGNTLYCSVPYQPHAWPDAYRRTTQDPIVGIALYGQTLVVATTRRPYIAIGADPASLTLSQLDIDAPCLSERSVCSIGTGVAWAAPDGLAVANAGGATIVTAANATRRQWLARWSGDMEAIFFDGRYMAFARSGQSMLLEMGRDRVRWSTMDTLGAAPCIDPYDDSLQFALVENGAAQKRYTFQAGSLMPAIWRSGVFTMRRPTNLGLGQVFAGAYPVNITVGYANVGPNGQTGGEITESYELTVHGSAPFRLPAGFLSREYQITVSTSHAVQAVTLTDSADDLR